MLRICFEGRCVNWDVKNKKSFLFWRSLQHGVLFCWLVLVYLWLCVVLMYVCLLSVLKFRQCRLFHGIYLAIVSTIYFPIVLFPNFIVWYFSLSFIYLTPFLASTQNQYAILVTFLSSQSTNVIMSLKIPCSSCTL